MSGRRGRYVSRSHCEAGTSRFPSDDSGGARWSCSSTMASTPVPFGNARPSMSPSCVRHVSWERQSPDREIKEQSRWGWLFYRRMKTGKTFYRPMNRFVHAHIRSIMPENPGPDDPVFLGGGTRPNQRFQQLCELAGIKPKLDAETGKATP